MQKKDLPSASQVYQFIFNVTNKCRDVYHFMGFGEADEAANTDLIIKTIKRH